MPISYEIFDDIKLVIVRASGVLTPAEVTEYQHDVWGAGRVSGYDEIFDLSAVEVFEYKAPAEVRDLAQLSSSMDWIGKRRKLALVSITDIGFGIARMYQAYRESDPASRIEVQVFRSFDLARAWLGK